MVHNESHRTHRISWLRAVVLGANDGIVSTSSLIIGVAAGVANGGGVAAEQAGHNAVMLAGVAGLIAGALSMAAGEYVSVHSQSDTEKADIALEKKHLEDEPEFELRELAGIYESRGLTPELANQVAEQLMEHDALGAHTRDELGISEVHTARPLQAAVFSAVAFSLGAILPLGVAWLSPGPLMIWLVAASSLVFLTMLGAVAARAGGAGMFTGAIRVLFWGALAMAATAGVGKLFGSVV